MVVSEITLQNFRNYSLQKVELSPQSNVFYGLNAQGKTNFLESVRYMSIGKSMRESNDKDLIMWGENSAKMRAVAVKNGVKRTVDVTLSRLKPKSLSINGLPISRIGELMGVIATVLFSPDEIAIVKNGPADRRKFMDIALCQLSKTYFYTLQRYNKVLQQRNSLIKSGRADENSLYVWDRQLAENAAVIARNRKGFVHTLDALASANHAFLTLNKEKLELFYEGTCLDSDEETVEAFLRALKEDRERDLRQGYTHCGVQTDDIKVVVGGVDVRKYGSQGQQRTAALSLKLSEVDLYRDRTGESPILLLDDVFSELDAERTERLVAKIDGVQSIITCTEPSVVNSGKVKYFNVHAGLVTPK